MKILTVKSKGLLVHIKLDDEDYERISKFNWTCSGGSIHRSYQPNMAEDGAYIEAKKRKTISVSIANEIHNTRGILYDHVDRDGLNNQKENLRPASRELNRRNSSKMKGSSSRYMGVCLFIRNNKFSAGLKFKGKRIHLGYFDTELEAAHAYNVACIKFGVDLISNLNKDEHGNIL